MAQEYEQLLLKNQICFPMYACGRKIVAAYTPYLKPLGLTYTQYIVFMVLWEHESVTVGQLGSMSAMAGAAYCPLETAIIEELRYEVDDMLLVRCARDRVDDE